MLAERAGIAEGTIYRHFRGKEELLNAAYREAQEWALAAVKEIEAERQAPVAERLRLVARRLLEEAGRNPSAIRMVLQSREQQYLDEASRSSARAFREALEQMMASGKSDGVVRSGPAELWAGVWLAVVSFAAERVGGGDWNAEHPQALLILDAAWSAVAASDGPEKK